MLSQMTQFYRVSSWDAVEINYDSQPVTKLIRAVRFTHLETAETKGAQLLIRNYFFFLELESYYAFEREQS